MYALIQRTAAQRPTDFGQIGTSTTTQKITEDSGPDSTVYDFVLLSDIFTKYKRSDTMADIAFMHNNLLVSKDGDYVNTGNFGSSAYPLIFRPNVFMQLSAGYHQYNIYRVTSENFRFYEQNRPLTDLYFSQIGSQENINVRSDFSRNFSDGLSVSLNFARISQKGFFTGQDVKNTGFGIGFRYKSLSNKYNAFLLIIHNATEESHIGGITNADELKAEFNKDLSVVLAQANTRNQEQEIGLVQYLKLTNAQKSGFNLYLKNDLKYKPAYYKYADNLINDQNDSTFYSGIQLDARGIRRYTTIDHLSNALYIDGEKKDGINGRLGLQLDYFNVREGALLPSQRLDLTATFDGKVPILKSLDIETTAKLGLGKNFGSFDLGGMLRIGIGKIGTLNGKLRFFRSEIAYNATRLIVNDNVQYDNDFSKPFGTEFGGNLYIKSLNIRAIATQTIINSPIYFGEGGRPVQADGVFSATRFSLTHQLRVGHFHLDNNGHVQLFNSNYFSIPPIYSTHQLYYQGAWFKKEMQVNLGLDLRFIPQYEAPAFHPLYGAFYRSSSELAFYPAANFFFMARISAFRIMILMENITQSITQDHNFDVVGHPQNDMKFRFGIQWLLKD